MFNLTLYVIISFTNVFLHIFRMLLVVKSDKLIASLANCVCYSFSAVVIKFISETTFTTAIIVAIVTNFCGCYVGMLVYEKFVKKNK